MAFFGEKYGERVRVVDVPGFSTELCGGCHVGRTGEIGAFKILSDKGLAAGVRRLEAVTALNAVERLQKDEEILGQLTHAANVPLDELPAKFKEVQDLLRRKEKEVAALKRDLALAGAGASGAQPGAVASGHSPSKKSSSSSADAADEGVLEISGVKVLARRVPSLPTNELPESRRFVPREAEVRGRPPRHRAGRQGHAAGGRDARRRRAGFRARARPGHGAARGGQGRRQARPRPGGRGRTLPPSSRPSRQAWRGSGKACQSGCLSHRL